MKHSTLLCLFQGVRRLWQHNRYPECFLLGIYFQNAAVGFDQLTDRIQSQTAGSGLCGKELSGFAFLQITIKGIGDNEEHQSHICLSADDDFLFSVSDLTACLQGIFQQIAQYHRECGFRQPDLLGKMYKHVYFNITCPCLLGEEIQYRVGCVVLAVNDGQGIRQGGGILVQIGFQILKLTAAQIFPEDTVLALRRVSTMSAITGKKKAERLHARSTELFVKMLEYEYPAGYIPPEERE